MPSAPAQDQWPRPDAGTTQRRHFDGPQASASCQPDSLGEFDRDLAIDTPDVRNPLRVANRNHTDLRVRAVRKLLVVADGEQDSFRVLQCSLMDVVVVTQRDRCCSAVACRLNFVDTQLASVGTQRAFTET